MADRATTFSGMFQKVTLGITSKVLGAGTYSLTGTTRTLADASEFGVETNIYEFGCADGGTITISDASYDPTCPEQVTLQSCVEDGVKLVGDSVSGLCLWVSSSSYLRCATTGHILMTKAGGVKADRCGLAKTDFEGQVSGGFMVLCTGP